MSIRTGERKKPLSQFGKAMAELDIAHIKALTPQAKGRIERLWGTFQDRLVIELRLLDIWTLEEANAVLPGHFPRRIKVTFSLTFDTFFFKKWLVHRCQRILSC